MNRHTHTRPNPLRAGLVLALLLVMPGSGFAADPGTLHIRFMQGDADIQTGDTGETIAAEVNAPLLEGDKLWLTRGARMELLSREGTVIRLDENSFLAVESMADGSNRFHLDVGRAYVHAANLRNQPSFTTPTLSARTTSPAVFALDVSDQGNTALSVFEGSVFVERPDGNLSIGAGRRAAFGGHGRDHQFFALAPLDQWEAWNRDRDREWSLAASSERQQYLPEELMPYAGDFASNGEWLYSAPYGYIWRPFVVVQSWAPYRSGYWRWVRGHYVWISYEPWGWVPYHYGRWVHHTAGWCWVPPRRGSVQWGPGYVGWVRTPTHIGWVPLAPHEAYRHPDFQRLPLVQGMGNDSRGAYGYHHLSVRNTMTSAPQAHAASPAAGYSAALPRPPRTIVPVGMRKPGGTPAAYAPRQGTRPGPQSVTKTPSRAPASAGGRIEGRAPEQALNARPLPKEKPSALPAVQSRSASQAQPARGPERAAAQSPKLDAPIQSRSAPAARPEVEHPREAYPERTTARPNAPERTPTAQKEVVPVQHAPVVAPAKPGPAQTQAETTQRNSHIEASHASQPAPRLHEETRPVPSGRSEPRAAAAPERKGISSFSPARKGF